MNLRSALAACAVVIAWTVAGAFCVSPSSAAHEPEELRALRAGTLARLQVHDSARPLPDHSLLDESGTTTDLSDRHKVLVVNFWATWCAPCRVEMPALDELEATLGGDSFGVVAINVERNGLEKSAAFYDENGIEHLPIYADERGRFAHSVGVLGLPATLVLNERGEEIARLVGPAEWDSPESIEYFSMLAGH